MRIFVCGDMGKAILFDISMGAHTIPKEDGKLMSLPKDQSKWYEVRSWFTAHYISKSHPNYVNTVKFCRSAGLYVTGCSNGEVRLWNAIDCAPMGMLNGKEWASGPI